MRTRIEREMAAAPPPGTYAGSGPSPASFASVSTPNAPHAGRTAIGIVVGLLIGIVGAIMIEKIGLYGHFTLSYFYIVLGYGIGWGIHQATRRGGAKMALIAVGRMVASLLVSHMVLAYDVLTAAQASGTADPSLRATDVFPLVVKQEGILHWVCIAIGLYACYRGVERR